MRRRHLLRVDVPLLAGGMAIAGLIGVWAAGLSLGPIPNVSTPLLVVLAFGAFAGGGFLVLLRNPDTVGRIAPTAFVLSGVLPLLRWQIPGDTLLRFVALGLVGGVLPLLVRGTPPLEEGKVMRWFAGAALATVASQSVLLSRGDSDLLRLVLLVGGIVVLLFLAPRVWAADWAPSVEQAMRLLFWAVAISSLAILLTLDLGATARFRGPFVNANTLAIAVALSVPFAAVGRRFMGAFPWTLALMLVVLSGSRAGLLALTAGFAVAAARQRRFLVLAVGTCLVGILLLLGAVRLETDHQKAAGANTRELIWGDLLDAAEESPVFGHGFGAADGFVFGPEVQRWVGESPETHSSYVDAIYEQGYLGLLLWAITLLSGCLLGWRAGGPWVSLAVAGAVGAGFESWLFAIGGGTGVLFWMSLGAIPLVLQGRRPVTVLTRSTARTEVPA